MIEHSLGDCPVLLIIFNRLEESLLVLDQIKHYRPRQLFVSADGARLNVMGEVAKCESVRNAVLDNIDWPCDVHTKFNPVNQGCKLAVSSAISWFFQNVSKGIILEDDCIPSDSFFPFMEILLDYYANDDRIGHIGGYNIQNGIKRGLSSYYFSRYYHVWGWGTWRRSWEGYSTDIEDYPQFLQEDVLTRIFQQPQIREFWKNNFDQVYTGQLDTWDYQWVYKNMKEGRLAIIPNVNLVRNIGFNEKGTHTRSHNESIYSNQALSLNIDDFSHPKFVVPDLVADMFTYETHCGLNFGEIQSKNKIDRLIMSLKRVLLAIAIRFGLRKA